MESLKVQLTAWQRKRLEQLRDRASHPRVVKRALCLLLSAAGEPATAIAQLTGLSRDGITDIRRRWRQRGLRGLADRPRAGRPPRIPAAYRRVLRQALRSSPLACGYVFTVWSIARLRTYLRQQTGVAIGQEWLRRLVHRQGFVLSRPKRTLRNRRNRRAYRRARRQLEALKKGLWSPQRPTNCGTPIAPSSRCCPI